MVSPQKMDPEGQEPSSKNDPSISSNKHLTRLVRFSILQARRSSHASKASPQNNKGAPPPSVDTRPPPHGHNPVSPLPSPPAMNSPQQQQGHSRKQSRDSPVAAEPYPFASFTGDKERPSTEVQYAYNDAPGKVSDDIGVTVDVPADPPIMEDLSASLTLSAGEHSYGGSISDDVDHAHEDMDLLLAPDSGSGGAELLGSHSRSSSEVYNSAEMYSSSGNYEESDHSSEMSSDSSDSIMRRVEEEIANARKASNDAQARLAYFTQKQKELNPVMSDSYSFDFETLETSDDLHTMLDVGESEDLAPPTTNAIGANQGQQQQRGGGHRNQHAPHAHDENFNNAMGVIGKEFDSGSTEDVDEKVDIEVVLAPSNLKSTAPPKQAHAPAQKSPAYNRRSPKAPSRSPRRRADDDSVDIDEAVITAVFSEKSIESLPVRDSLPGVFSEQSMESLPTQPTSSIALSSLGKPGSYSYPETSFSDYALSPGSQKRHNMLPNSNKALSPRQRDPHLSIETDGNFAARADVSPLASAPSSSPSKLPSTPREANTPSYRERLENKLKILGSRYPVSPSSKSATPTSKTSRFSADKREASASPSKTSRQGLPIPVPATPKDTISSPGQVVSPLGEAYDGLESRIKDLLARTLNPGPADAPQPGDNSPAYQSSPSAELKAIKKLLEQGVAAAAAAEERKRELQEKQEEQGATPTASDPPTQSESEEFHVQEQEQDLHFPVLDEHEDGIIPEVSEEQSQVSKSKSHESTGSRGSRSSIDRLPMMRSSGLVPPVMETIDAADEAKDPEPSVTCSTSEEILEALDSFSQSTEFKSKSRKISSPKSSPSKTPREEENALSSKVKEVLYESDESPNESDAPPQNTDNANSGSRVGKLSSSLMNYFENAMKPSGPEAFEIKRCVQQERELPASESATSVIESDTDNFETVANSGSLQENESETAAPEEHDESPAIPGPVESDTAIVDNDSHEVQYDERSEYESCTENAKDDFQTERIAIATAAESKPTTTTDDHHAQATAKKTPSVLNAALSRPSVDIKDRRGKEKKTPHKATTITSEEEEKPESDTDAAVVSSGSHTTDEGSVEQTYTSFDAVENEEVSKVPAGDVGQNEEHNIAKPAPVSNHIPASPVPDIQAGPTDENESSESENDPIVSENQSMLASLIGPASNAEQEESPTPATTDPNENEKGGRDTPPPARVKSVTVQSPPKSTAKDSAKSVLQEKNENSKPQAAGSNNKSASSRSDRKIRFRDPYPTPKPCRKPRSTEEIHLDHQCSPSNNDRKIKWKEPKGDLKRLLVAALDSSVSRRSNACGALKVISKLEKNKVVLVRTKGFLEALVFVATDEITSDEPEAKEDARARAISCIYNVSHVKQNRLIVCTHSGLLDCLVKTINEDRGEARTEACGILAQLAKSPICRDMMVNVDELLSTLASVLKGTIDPEEKMLDVLSEDITEDIPSSYSEMSSVLSEEHIPFPKSPRSGRKGQQAHHKLRANCSIRKQKSEMYDQYFELARLSSCAALIHMSKQCSILDHFCSNMFLLESIVQVARDSASPLHGKCLEMLCNVSRLPGNTAMMTRFPGMVDTLVGAGSSKESIDRVWSLRTLQNMTSDASSKAPLATSTLLTLLINCVTSKNTDEQHAAMATLLNLSTDPSAVVPITSTKNVLATLVYLAHNSDSTSEIRLMACNALATVGLWLQTVSGFGSIPEEARRVLLPSHKTTGWDIWD